MIRFAPEQVLSFRLARHGLAERAKPHELHAVTERLVGVQAQLLSAGCLSLAARIDGLGQEHLDRALYEERSLARTWCMRGTVHLVSHRVRPVLATALGAHPGGLRRWLLRTGDVSEEDLARMNQQVLDALDGGAPLTRAELRAKLGGDAGDGPGLFGSWGGVLRVLAQEGHLVFGPPRGVETTFVRADRWWRRGRAAEHEPERALADVLERYLAVYGPATLRDFAYWSGMPAAKVKEAARALAGATVEVGVNGTAALLLAKDVRELEGARATREVRLLPAFDTWLLGHKDKSPFLDASRQKQVFRTAGWISQVVLEGGRVVGTWTHETKGKALEVSVVPFVRLAPATRAAIEGEADRYARFLGSSTLRVSGTSS